MFIASFLMLMFSRLIPPSSVGRSNLVRLMGGDLRLFHMKVRIFFVIAVSIDFGMPCALVRN